LTTEPANDIDAISKWQLKPVLPRKVNASKLQTLALATTAAVATTVALPFVLGGAAAMLGIAEVGLAAEVLAGSVVVAEAMVDIVVVGATARTLLYNVNVGMEDDRENKNVTRPFCSWRDW
jgi:phosphoribosylformylglycinamidine (FGAM) synthase-like enzyme